MTRLFRSVSSRRPPITAFVALIAVSSSICVAASDVTTERQRQPNFVFVLVDDLGWADVGYQGSIFYETPNIDQLASSGTQFTNAYASSPVCSPTRAAILTGKHPARLKITNWIPGDDPHDRSLLGPAIKKELPLDEVTLAEALKEAGYVTFFAGKWHLGDEFHSPTEQGFDTNIGGVSLGRPPGGYYSPYDNPKLSDGPSGEYLTDRLTSEALSFLGAAREKPFFLYLSYYSVHTPLEGADRHLERFTQKRDNLPITSAAPQVAEHAGMSKQRQDNAAYASMIYALDENIGRLVESIRLHNLQDNTYIIFTSDNGGRSTLYGAGDATSNLPLRAGKGWVYEGGIRVPLIVSGPDIRAATTDSLVTSTDFYPTILELARAASRPDESIDGVSFAPVLGGAPNGRRERVFAYFPHYHGSASTPSSALRIDDWKLVVFHESDTAELYDLRADPGERNDLAGRYPSKVAAMRQEIERWKNDVGASHPIANDGYVPGTEKLNFRGLTSTRR